VAKKVVKYKKQLAHKRTKRTLSFERRRQLEGLSFMVPWLLGFLIFILIPLALSIKISFYSPTLNDLYRGKYVGLANYKEVIKNPSFGQAVFEAFMNSLYQVPLVVGFALFVAVLLKQEFPGRVIFRVIFFIPVILSGVVMSYLFSEDVGSVSVFSQLVQSNTGFMSRLFGGALTTHIGNIMWSSSVEILIFLAALQSVPDILYEVVELDGANAWERFWHITLPYISPFVILNCIYALVDSFVDARNPVMSILYGLMVQGTKYGVASALSWFYMLLSLITILIFILLTRRWLR
jgi:ABC-type sugar transport system permease subunit